MGSLPMSPTVHNVAVDPFDPKRVYAAGPAGLFLSDDAGLTWVDAATALEGEPIAVAVDAFSPERVFVVMTDATVWQSIDGGSTWRNMWPGGEAK